MSSSYGRVYNSICGYLTPTLVSLALIIVLISLFDLLAIVFSICVSRVWTPLPEQDQRPVPTTTQGQANGQGPTTYPPTQT